MTFKSCDMVYHPTKDGVFYDWPPGHFYWTVDPQTNERHIWMMLPRADNERGSPCIVMVYPTNDSPAWNWDGNLEKPTLTPSVFHDPRQPDSPHHWHGFITAGRMVGC